MTAKHDESLGEKLGNVVETVKEKGGKAFHAVGDTFSDFTENKIEKKKSESKKRKTKNQ